MEHTDHPFKILIIDDSSHHVDALQALILWAHPEASVVSSPSAAEVSGLVRLHRPDVLIAAVMMPGTDMIDCCLQIRQDEAIAETAIVLLTEHGTDDLTRIKALEAGADAFLTKPIDRIELRALLRLLRKGQPSSEPEGQKNTGDQPDEHLQVKAILQANLMSLILPGAGSEDIEFDNLFDIDEIQQIQDKFSAATRVASIITRPDGVPITRPSNFCRLCSDVIRATEKGRMNCWKSDAAIGRQNPGGPVIQRCLSGGLWDAGASISVGEHHVANWLIGQVKDQNHDRKSMEQYAVEIGADPAEFLAALDEVPIMSKEQFSKVADALFVISRQLSEKAFQNAQQARFISQLQNAEKALQERDNLYQSFMNSHSDMMFIKDAERKYLVVNDAALHNYGLTREEIIGKTDHDVFPGSFASRCAEFDTSVLTTSQAKVAEDVVGDRIIEITKFPLRLTDGSIGIGGIIRDITASIKAREEIEQTKQTYIDIFNSVSEAIYIQDPDTGKFIDVNAGAEKIYNINRSEIIGKTPESIAAPGRNDLQEIRRRTNEVFETGRPTTFDFWAVRANGEIFPKEVIVSKGKYFGKEVLIATARDISDRKRAEAIKNVHYQLGKTTSESTNLNDFFKKIHSLLNQILDATNFYIAFYRPDSDTLHAPYQYDFFGSIDEWPAAKSCTGYVVKNNQSLLMTREKARDLLDQGILKNIGQEAECWLGVPLHDGSKVIGALVVQSYTNPTAYDENDKEILENFGRHVTMAMKRGKDEDQIRLLSKSVEQSPVSIVITDTEGNIEYVNPRFTAVTGFSFAEAIGQNPRILKSGLQTPAIYENLWKEIQSGKSWFGELENRKKNGETFWEFVGISPITDHDGQIAHFIAVKEDISDRKKLIRELIEAKEKAQESDQLKTAFLNNVSHEIRTPFNGILGFLGLIEDETTSLAERKSYISSVNKSAERLMNTLNDIVEVSKIQTGQCLLDPSEIQINTLVSRVIDLNRPLTQSKPLIIKNINQIHQSDYTFQIDVPKTQLVLNTLINNAIKFTRQGSVELNTSLHETGLHFEIKDTGIGIDPDKQDHIFEPFMQGDVSTTRGYEGSGLGLTIAKAHVTLMGGTISFTSIPGTGTSFFVQLPYQPNAKSPDPATPSPIRKLATPQPSVLQHHDEIILVAEDDNANFQYIEVILRKAGYQVMRAYNGHESIDKFKHTPGIRLILMDMKMPLLDGYKATQELRKLDKTIPIVALTAYAFPSDRSKALECGCADYLAKPVKKAELLQIIEKNLINHLNLETEP